MAEEEERKEGVSQNEIQDLLFNREIGWQEIIYDLINTEQLDPWNIDITILTGGFLTKIQAYEETDFFVSSKVLLAAALLLRIKSELILSRYMKSIDDILFGREEEIKTNSYVRIDLDEDIPDLIPRSPMPRFRRVTLSELIESLNKAITTENRRIKKVIVNSNALRETGLSLPQKKHNIKHKIKMIHGKVIAYFDANKSHKKVSYTNLVGKNKEERVLSFFPVLQLENDGHLWLEQDGFSEEIHVWLKDIFLKHNPNPYQDLLDGEWNNEHIDKGKIVTEEKIGEQDFEGEDSLEL